MRRFDPICRRWCLALLLVVSAAGSSVVGQRPPDVAIETTKDLIYLEGGDPKLHAARLLHSRRCRRRPCHRLYPRRCVTAGETKSLSRRSPGSSAIAATFWCRSVIAWRRLYVTPAWIEDTAAAFAWVRRNIDDYGGDPERIGLIGHSAGAQLGGLLITDDTMSRAVTAFFKHHLAKE